MSYETLNNSIRSRFKTLVTDAVPLATAFDNAPFTKPASKATPYCRLTIRHGQAFQVDSGGTTKRHRRPGSAIVEIYTPLEKGDKEALELADAVVTAFLSISVSGVTFRTPWVSRHERNDELGHWQTNVNIEFYSDHVA